MVHSLFLISFYLPLTYPSTPTHTPTHTHILSIVTPVQWRSFSAHNTQHAQDEMRVSVQLREAINHTLQRTTADLEAQWRATNYAFRKRLHEMEQTRQELEWQRKNVSPISFFSSSPQPPPTWASFDICLSFSAPLVSFPASHTPGCGRLGMRLVYPPLSSSLLPTSRPI